MSDILKQVLLKDQSILRITKASIHDAPFLINFLNRVGGETDFLTFGLNGFPLTVAEEEDIINECLLVNKKLMLVGKIDDTIVAQLFLTRSNNPRLCHIGDIGITVLKKYWGLSIAKNMLVTAINWAKEKEISRLELLVRSDHLTAINLYQKLGFQIEGTMQKAIKIKERYYANYIMALIF